MSAAGFRSGSGPSSHIQAPDPVDTEALEVQLLLDGIYRKYGYDFRNYSLAHVTRRILNRVSTLRLKTITELLARVLHNREAFHDLLLDLSINVTEMFRDPAYYRSFRKEIVPVLKTYPFVKIWHAGCATGEEVYSTAIILLEEGLYDRAQIYATDFNQQVLRRAKDGIFSLSSMKEYTSNYQTAGGTGMFSDYYVANDDFAMIDKRLKERIVFADHNLVTDGAFGEMQVIVCRNVLIYFNRQLQERVIGLFLDSLCPGGFLCIGLKESLMFTGHASDFAAVSEEMRIFRRISTTD